MFFKNFLNIFSWLPVQSATWKD